MNFSQNLSTQQDFQYPTLAGGSGGHDAPTPTTASTANASSTISFQIGSTFPISTVPNLQQSNLYSPQWAGTGNPMLDLPFIPNHGILADNPSQWADMDFTDDMLADIPIMANPGAPGDYSFQQTPPPPPPAAPIPAQQATGNRIPCTFCMQTFARDPDRIRHENSIHLNISGQFLCPHPPCPKSQGEGYRRQDKLTEHLWKKHAALGYVKRV